MNEETDNKEIFLSWQGQISGPHKLKDVRNLLKLGKIHSLYKAQVDGQWILLRDHLASLEKITQKQAAAKIVEPLPQPVATRAPMQAIRISEDQTQDIYNSYSDPALENQDVETPVPAGIAITSFILSLFFFVPFLNIITWLMSLILGHLALAAGNARSSSKAATMAWLGLWISYVQVGYTLINLVWFLGTDILPMWSLYFIIHGQMLGNSIGALIGATVLMLAVQMTTGHLIRFSRCYIGALLPSAVSALCTAFLQVKINNSTLNESASYLLIGLLVLVLFVGQIFFWARFIRLPNDDELGIPRAAIASLICTIVFIFVFLGFFLLMSILIT